jgi:hypothetical protein
MMMVKSLWWHMPIDPTIRQTQTMKGCVFVTTLWKMVGYKPDNMVERK